MSLDWSTSLLDFPDGEPRQVLVFKDGRYDVVECDRRLGDEPKWFNGDVFVSFTHWAPLEAPE